MTTPRRTRAWRLASRPTGTPTADDFELFEVDLPDLDHGQVLVENLVMSVDPYMRGRMRAARSYAAPWGLGQVMRGSTVGRVVASRSDDLGEATHVVHDLGWREHAIADAATVRPIEAGTLPLSYHLGVLGMPGLTAYVGLSEVAGLAEGETVFVSGAAGAVGSVAGQIARLQGARVIGSAGSAEKVRWLEDDLGFHAGLNYRDGTVADLLADVAPDGIDVYFDNVGGDHLEAAIGQLRPHGRVAVCGMISQYNDIVPSPGPRNLGQLITNRLTIRGFLVADHAHLQCEFGERMSTWLANGDVTVRETVVDGLERAVDAFLGLFEGDNIGKMLVRLGSDQGIRVIA